MMWTQFQMSLFPIIFLSCLAAILAAKNGVRAQNEILQVLLGRFGSHTRSPKQPLNFQGAEAAELQFQRNLNSLRLGGFDYQWSVSPTVGFPQIVLNDTSSSHEIRLSYDYDGAVSSQKYLGVQLFRADCVTLADSSALIISNNVTDETRNKLIIDVDIIQTKLQRFPTEYSQLNATTSQIHFCVRVDYYRFTGTNGLESINFYESNVTVTIDFASGFDLTGVNATRGGASQEEGNTAIQCQVQAYFCNSQSTMLTEPPTLVQGDIMTICIEVSELDRDVYHVTNVLDMRLEQMKLDGSANRADVVIAKHATALSDKFCRNGICKTQHLLQSKFFEETNSSKAFVQGQASCALGPLSQFSTAVGTDFSASYRQANKIVADVNGTIEECEASCLYIGCQAFRAAKESNTYTCDLYNIYPLDNELVDVVNPFIYVYLYNDLIGRGAFLPSGLPAKHPSRRPVKYPSSHPSHHPFRHPSGRPSKHPIKHPSAHPSHHPFKHPSSRPSHHPYRHPSARPSKHPIKHPSARPSHHPVKHPSSHPSHHPSVYSKVQISSASKLTSYDGTLGDNFGYSVAFGSTFLAISAYKEDNRAIDGGCVYIYVDVGNSVWKNETRLTASDGKQNDYFGYQIAASGNTLVVGAYANDYSGADAGAAYVYTRSDTGSWAQVQRLLPNNGNLPAGSPSRIGDQFGKYVALSGSTIVVSNHLSDNTNGVDKGSVHVYIPDGSGKWTQEVGLISSLGSAVNGFGKSVAIDGNTLVIGSLNSFVFVYVRSNGSWAQQARLTANDNPSNANYGDFVDVQGDTVAVGAWGDDIIRVDQGSVYLFVRNQTSSTWTQYTKLTASDGSASDMFGIGVHLHNQNILFGLASNNTNANGAQAGAVYVFVRRQDGTWVQRKKIISQKGASKDYFGVSLDSNNKTVIIGAWGDDTRGTDAGAVYLYSWAYI